MQDALRYVANSETILNNQIEQLSARSSSVTSYLDNLTDQLDTLVKPDLIENAMLMTSLSRRIAEAATGVTLDNQYQDTIFRAAQRLLVAASAASAAS